MSEITGDPAAVGVLGSANPPRKICLNGEPMTFAALVQIGGRSLVPVADENGLDRVRAARSVIEKWISTGLPVYGSTTGVGAMKDVSWSPDEVGIFNLGLVRAHHFGTGSPFPPSVVRNAMAIRVNTALTGRVGCSVELVAAYLRLLAADVVPVVRRTGSIGCADIGLMGQIGAVLTGVGEAAVRGQRMPADAALAVAGLQPLKMAPRQPGVDLGQRRGLRRGSGGAAPGSSRRPRADGHRLGHGGSPRCLTRPLAGGRTCWHAARGGRRCLAVYGR